MKNPESGAGWEVLRQFVDPQKAILAGQEVVTMLNEQSKYLVKSDYSPPGMSGLTAYILHAWHLGTYKNYPDTLQNDEQALAKATNIVELHRRLAKLTSRYVNTGQINVYEPHGYTRRHRDRVSGETVAVGLMGVGHAVIKDPVFETWHEFDILPGDAVHFVNPRQQRQRPYHQFINQTDDLRIALVE